MCYCVCVTVYVLLCVCYCVCVAVYVLVYVLVNVLLCMCYSVCVTGMCYGVCLGLARTVHMCVDMVYLNKTVHMLLTAGRLAIPMVIFDRSIYGSGQP